MAERIGQQLGNYRLTRLLGTGGFAEVYLGEHVYLGTEAAIKVLTMQLVSIEVDRFLIEARTVARLLHPNIVRVLDFGVEDSNPFIVMDYAPNGTLRQRVPKGASLAPMTIIPYVKQIAAALQYAHQEKLIHRDIKPENMLVGRNNEVLLSDFGLALVVQGSRSIDTGELAGTVTYMAPEQIQGRPRQASDQYSLAVAVYEWLSGKLPFYGSLTELVTQHLSAPPPPLREQNPSISPSVEQVVMTALEKDPQKRFKSVQAFAEALEEVIQREPPLASTVYMQVKSFSQVLPPTNTQSVDATICTYRGHSAPIYTLLWSPDSTRIASGGEDKTVQIWDAFTGNKGITCRGHSERVTSVAWSPESKRVISGSEDKTVRMWNAATGETIFTYLDPAEYAVRAVAWSPNGKRIVVAGAHRTTRVWNVDTNTSLFTYSGHTDSITSIAWSPNGKRVASGGDILDSSVQVWEAADGRSISAYRASPRILSVAWSPNSKQVASGSEDGTIQKWDTETDQNLLTYPNGAAVYVVAWSPDGQYFAFGGDDKSVQVWSTTTNRRVFTYNHTAASVRAMAWSPDGRYIASGGSDNIVQVWVAP